MMKKAVHIIFLCLFFLLGLQCLAGNKKSLSLPYFEVKKCESVKSFAGVSKQQKNATFSSLDKLHKKKRFSRTHYNAIASLSKCNGLNLGFGTFSNSKFLFLENPKLLKDSPDYSFHNSFCHRKLLSIFYSFQAFW
jgi:hypothetical protein